MRELANEEIWCRAVCGKSVSAGQRKTFRYHDLSSDSHPPQQALVRRQPWRILEFSMNHLGCLKEVPRELQCHSRIEALTSVDNR